MLDGQRVKLYAANRPAYIRIANDLRNRIATGDPTPGTRLPARQELAVVYQAAEGVVREATQLLLREGLLVSKPGAGAYVRERPQPRLLVRSRFWDRQDGSPFGPAIEEQGRHGSLEYTSDTMQAPAEIRERLGLAEADGHRHDVMRTAYLFSTKDEGPWMLLTSWEPLALT